MYVLTRAVAGLVTGALPINAHHSDPLHEASQVTFIILEKRLDLGVQFDGVVVCIATRHVSDGVPLREERENFYSFPLLIKRCEQDVGTKTCDEAASVLVMTNGPSGIHKLVTRWTPAAKDQKSGSPSVYRWAKFNIRRLPKPSKAKGVSIVTAVTCAPMTRISVVGVRELRRFRLLYTQHHAHD